MKTIAVINDAYHYTNGIKTIYENIVKYEIEKYKDKVNLIVVHLTKDFKEEFKKIKDNVYYYTHKPKIGFKFPLYPDLLVAYARKDIIETIEGHLGGKIDLIHIATQAFLGKSVAKIVKNKNIPLVGFYHTFIPKYVEHYLPGKAPEKGIRKRLYNYIGKLIDKKTFKYCDKMICHTPRTGEFIKKYLKDCEIFYITEFLEMSNINDFKNSGNLKKIKNSKKSKLKLGYIGRISKEKSVVKLLKHNEYLKENNIELHLLGDGPLYNKLSKKYKNNSEIIFYGCLKDETFLETVAGLDFNIITALNETLNMTLLETGALGVPSVAIRNTSPSDVINQYDSGLIIDKLENTDWIDKLIEIHSNKSEYNKLTQNSIKMAEENSLSIGAKKLIDIWLETTSK